MINKTANKYWMRSVSFTGLLRMLKAIAQHPDGLRSGEINTIILSKNIRITRRNIKPSKTTIYHYRHTLLQLKAINREGARYCANHTDNEIAKLIKQPEGSKLNETARNIFINLVMRNAECIELFFSMFMPDGVEQSSIESFRRHGKSVVWHRASAPETGVVFKKIADNREMLSCDSPAKINAVLYGLRYWARDELAIIDEYSHPQKGVIMFPLNSGIRGEEAFLNGIKKPEAIYSESNQWTTFSILDLIKTCCEGQKQPVSTLHKSIEHLCREWPGHIYLIPTPIRLATLTAKNRKQEELDLRNFYRDQSGGYISHIRIHSDALSAISRKIEHDIRNH